jgi:hypothetical protein
LKELQIKGDSTYFDPISHKIVYGSKLTFGPYANDPRDDLRVNAKIKYVNTTGKFGLYALEDDIEKGEEIFVAYGDDYWCDVNINQESDID